MIRTLASFPIINLAWCLLWCLPVALLWFIIKWYEEQEELAKREQAKVIRMKDIRSGAMTGTV